VLLAKRREEEYSLCVKPRSLRKEPTLPPSEGQLHTYVAKTDVVSLLAAPPILPRQQLHYNYCDPLRRRGLRGVAGLFPTGPWH